MTAQPRWRRQRVRVRQLAAHSWSTRRETRRECVLRSLGIRRRPPKVATPYDDLLDTLTARVRSELDYPTTEDA